MTHQEGGVFSPTPAVASPYDQHFAILEVFENGRVREYIKIDKSKSDYEFIKAIAFEKARIGHDVDIMPELHEHDTKIRSIIYPDVIGFKNLDLRIDNILCDVKQPKNPNHANTVKHRISSGAHQAGFVIIDLIAPLV